MKRKCVIWNNCEASKGYELDHCASAANSVVHVECEAEIVYLLFDKTRVRAMKKLQSIRDIASVVMLPMRRHASSFEPEEGSMMFLTHDRHVVRWYGAELG